MKQSQKIIYSQVWRNWQTRMVQVHVKAISCRFKSCYLHQRDSYPNCPFSHAKISENARKWLEYWGFDFSHNQVGFLSVSVKQDKMLSFLQPYAVRFAVRMAGFIDKYKRIIPQTAVNLIPTAGKWRIIYRRTIFSIQIKKQSCCFKIALLLSFSNSHKGLNFIWQNVTIYAYRSS